MNGRGLSSPDKEDALTSTPVRCGGRTGKPPSLLPRSKTAGRPSTSRRLPALDGLRGVLALLVVVHHTLQLTSGSLILLPLSQVAVAMFFVLSGLVLARGWDGRFGVFLMRRFVRLWPTYAVCLLAGYLAMGLPIEPAKFLWFPMVDWAHGNEMDVPIWTLFIEVWAMLFMPLFVFGSRGAWQFMVGAWIVVLATMAVPRCAFGLFFLVGAYLGRFDWRSRALEARWAQWLGQVSYSLYLSHWIVLHALGRWGVLAVLPVAWALWRAVERPSIEMSRMVGRAREKVLA